MLAMLPPVVSDEFSELQGSSILNARVRSSTHPNPAPGPGGIPAPDRGRGGSVCTQGSSHTKTKGYCASRAVLESKDGPLVSTQTPSTPKSVNPEPSETPTSVPLQSKEPLAQAQAYGWLGLKQSVQSLGTKIKRKKA